MAEVRPAVLDPIALEIQWKRLVSMVDEASTAFIRTSFSVLVREANDFAVDIKNYDALLGKFKNRLPALATRVDFVVETGVFDQKMLQPPYTWPVTLSRAAPTLKFENAARARSRA